MSDQGAANGKEEMGYSINLILDIKLWHLKEIGLGSNV